MSLLQESRIHVAVGDVHEVAAPTTKAPGPCVVA